MFLIYIIYALSTLLSLLMGLLVFFDDTKNKINKIFAVISLSVTGWIATLLMLYSIEDPIYLLWVGRLNFALVLIMLCSLLHFTVIFPYELFKFKKILNISFYWATFFFFVTLFTPLVSKEEIIVLGGGRETIYGSLYWLYIINFIVFTLLSIGLILYKLKKDKENKTRRQSFLFLGGFAISLFIGFITNIALPFFGIYDAQNYGSIAPLFFIASISYAIVKHHLFNIKVVIAELLTFAIWTAVIAQAVMAETINGKILGAVTFVFVIFIGIFLIKSVKKEVALREEIEQLAGRLKSVNRIMSHDIKNVLGKDKDMFGMLLDGSFGALSDQARPFLQQAHDDTKKLIRSVIVILESGHELVLKPEKFDFKEAVLEVARDVEPEATTKGLTLTTNIPEDGDYMLVGDRVQLVTHVLKNLVENAVNYTLTGGVTVELSKKEKSILFSVKDTGVGISDEDKPNMFKEGSHGKDSLKMNVHSTGYGLFSVKKIVDAHNGKVWFDTAPGKGTTFFVELPKG